MSYYQRFPSCAARYQFFSFIHRDKHWTVIGQCRFRKNEQKFNYGTAPYRPPSHGKWGQQIATHEKKKQEKQKRKRKTKNYYIINIIYFVIKTLL